MTDVAAGWDRLETHSLPTSVTAAPLFKHFKPFSAAVTAFVAEAQDGERIFLGIPEFDDQIRGVGRGQLMIVNGYSHSGKTLLTTHMLRHNRNKRIMYVSPDEPAQLLLAKFAAATHRVPADQIEDMVARGDEAAIELLRQTAEEQYPNLIVFDKPVRSNDLEEMWEESCAVFGAPPECVILDYLELLQAGETVQQKADFIKGFGSRHEVPLIVLHQTSRSAGAEGKRMTISSGSYGGEQHATFQIGVWRKQAAIAAELVECEDKIARAANGASEQAIEKRDRLKLDLEKHAFTLTAAITKNKRPGRREGRSEIDFELFGETGVLVPLGLTDLPVQYRALLDERRAQQQYAAGHVPPTSEQDASETEGDSYYDEMEMF